MSTASPPPTPDEWTEASITAEAVAIDFWAAVRSPLVVLSSSVAGRVAAAALLLWLLAAMTTCMLPTLTQPERFARYVAYYEQRHALWSGLAAPPDLVRRLWAYVLGEHGLLRSGRGGLAQADTCSLGQQPGCMQVQNSVRRLHFPGQVP